MTEMELDDMDLEILDVVGDHSYWKNKIHGEMESVCGVREVAKRVDALVQEGYLESTIIAPAEISPDLIIAFKRTEKGDKAVNNSLKSEGDD